MDGYLHFENAIYCFHNRNFLRFLCSQSVFITDFFFIPNITPGGLFSGGGGVPYTWKEFFISKVGS